MEALALLKAAISLLLAIQALGPLATDDLKQQANDLAQAAIASATYQIAHPDMTDSAPAASSGSHNGSNAQTPDSTANEPVAGAQAATQAASIEIVSVDSSKELGDTYEVAPDGTASWSDAPDSAMFANLGAIVRDGDGNVLKDVEVTVSAGDQGKTMNGTGNFWGAPHNVPYYPFQYLFTEAGDHVITFTVGDASQSVTLKAE